MSDINNSTEQTANTQTPEATGDQGKKLFTQEDVDRIVGERLARERKKLEPSQEDQHETALREREAVLEAREHRIDCLDYLREKKYSSELADILDTDDVERFKEKVDKLARLDFGPVGPTIQVDLSGPLSSCGTSPGRDAFADAFKPPKI